MSPIKPRENLAFQTTQTMEFSRMKRFFGNMALIKSLNTEQGVLHIEIARMNDYLSS